MEDCEASTLVQAQKKNCVLHLEFFTARTEKELFLFLTIWTPMVYVELYNLDILEACRCVQILMAGRAYC